MQVMAAGYRILAHRQTCEKCAAYIEDLRSGALAGGYLGRLLPEVDRSTLTVEALIYDNSEYQKLFTKGEMDIVRKRLSQYQYKPVMDSG